MCELCSFLAQERYQYLWDSSVQRKMHLVWVSTSTGTGGHLNSHILRHKSLTREAICAAGEDLTTLFPLRHLVGVHYKDKVPLEHVYVTGDQSALKSISIPTTHCRSSTPGTHAYSTVSLPLFTAKLYRVVQCICTHSHVYLSSRGRTWSHTKQASKTGLNGGWKP